MEYAPVISLPAACILLAVVMLSFAIWGLFLWLRTRR